MTVPPTIRTTVFSDLEGSRDAWLRMESLAGTGLYPFQRYAWMAVWYGTIGMARDVQPHILLIEDTASGASILLPLGIRRSGRLSLLEWLGTGVSDYAGPIAGKASDVCTIGQATIMGVAMQAGRKAGCDALALDRIPQRLADGTGNPFLLDSRLPGRRAGMYPAPQAVHYSAHGLNLPEVLEAYLAERFSAKERYNLRRAEKKLAELGTFEFRVAGTAAERLEQTRAMIGQKRARYLATGAVDNFASKGTELFYLEAAARPELGVDVSALLLDGKPVATHWGVRGGGTMYYLMTTFDAALERYSPGKVFLLRFLRRCIDEGLARLDFTIGDEAYKDKFCDDAMALYATVAGLTLSGRLYAARERALAKLKHGPLLGLARSIRHKARSALRNYRNGGTRS